jgi:DNA uptake protein ComE-like DNA-binding protein
MSRRILFFIIFFLGVRVLAFGQSQQDSDSLELLMNLSLEKIGDQIGEDDESSSLFDELSALEETPLNLNDVSEEDLQRIPGMTNLIASRIIIQRSIKPFQSKRELLSIQGISKDLYSTIKHYVVMRKNRENRDTFSFLHRSSTELEKRKGFVTGEYPGSQIQVLNKIHGIYNRDNQFVSSIDVGAVTKKDPGESNYTDFTSGYISCVVPSLSSRCIIGDYQLETGEGLVFWSASAFSKGSNTIAPARKNGKGIHPYFSINENAFFRGIAISFEKVNQQFQFFYSNRTIHASIDTLGQLSVIDQTGKFRTENELRKKNATRELIIGYHTSIKPFDDFKIGFTGYKNHFSNPYITKGLSAVSVSDLWIQSVDLSYSCDGVDLFSELAYDVTHSVAAIGGITYEPIHYITLTFIGRRYPPTFQSIHGNAFGESQRQNQNETGVYCGIQLRPFDPLTISAYFDQYEFPNPTAFIRSSSNGYDYLIYAEYQASADNELSFRYKKKETQLSTENYDLYGRAFDQLNPRIQNTYRLMNKYLSSSSMHLSSKFEFIHVEYRNEKKTEKGFLLSQSLQCRLLSSTTLQTRVTFFDTESYDSRLYDFENDLPGAYSNPALFGRGIRWYAIVRYDLFLGVYITMKYSETYKEGVKSIGTGLDEMMGNHQSTLSIQMYIKY